MTGRRASVILFAREHCGLCEHMKEAILAVQSKVPFDFCEIDIDKRENKNWLRKYMFDVPVVHVNGQEAFKHRLEDRDVLALERLVKETLKA
ncbi:hypothetical protein O5D80_004510 [Batrachochytrium dendrobatidis]|nr:hypothetical protein O5D80_004510 [Batrachochytrium dendrobatidis]